MPRRLILGPLPGVSTDEFWSFVLWTGRSIYDPWWNTSEADHAFKQWREAQDEARP